MENKLKLIIRIIASPFVFALLIISHFTFVIIRTTDFIRFGGEFIHYRSNEERATIAKILEEINEKYGK
jgi:hypothetical protein